MIYTVTLNPSIDYVIGLPDLKLGQVNRLKSAHKFPGGKGINVSRILNEIKVVNKALGFLGGFTGTFIEQKIKELQVASDFVHIKSDSRINVKIHAQKETELNANGPEISNSELEQFLKKFNNIKAQDVVVFSGSIPKNLPNNLYDQIIKIIKDKGAEFVVDTTGQALLDTLPNKPLLIKPNNFELGELFGVTIKNDADVINYGKKLIEMGAQNVMVSMAEKGGMLITIDHVYKSEAPKGTVLNSVGAGDSMLAGFIGQYEINQDFQQAFQMGLACGSATAFSLDIANRQKIDEVFKNIKITKVE